MTTQAETSLLAHKINPSYQRVKILEYLLSKRNHPTIDMIYSDLKREMPKLSKTTIYNTLKLFIERDVVNPVNIEDNILRYDAETKMHGHFKCVKCGAIIDLDIDFATLDSHILKGYTISEHHINFKGTCNKKSCTK